MSQLISSIFSVTLPSIGSRLRLFLVSLHEVFEVVRIQNLFPRIKNAYSTFLLMDGLR